MHFRLTDDNIADYFGKAILENVLPEALDPLYHINFIAQAKLFRLKSDLNSFRTSLRGVDSNMAHKRLWERRELTAKLTKVCFLSYFDSYNCEAYLFARMPFPASVGSNVTNGPTLSRTTALEVAVRTTRSLV